MEIIWYSAVYIRESKSSHLSKFYYLVFLESYLEEKNTFEPYSAV